MPRLGAQGLEQQVNIITATRQYNTARQLKAAGRELDAARAYLAAQRFAVQCRSAKRDDIAFAAHTGATLSAARVLEISTDPAERSEAGRIKAKSGHLFRNA